MMHLLNSPHNKILPTCINTLNNFKTCLNVQIWLQDNEKYMGGILYISHVLPAFSASVYKIPLLPVSVQCGCLWKTGC